MFVLDSPYKFTSLIAAGGILSAAGFFGASLHPWTLPTLVICVAAILIGTVGLYWAASSLGKGVRNERWPEEALTPFRRAIDHPAWKVIMGLLLVAMLVALANARPHRVYFWCVFVLLQAQTQIGSAFARPTKLEQPGTLIHRSEVPHLDSEHWGER